LTPYKESDLIDISDKILSFNENKTNKKENCGTIEKENSN
jgi:hypothetical protein